MDQQIHLHNDCTVSIIAKQLSMMLTEEVCMHIVVSAHTMWQAVIAVKDY